MQKIIGVGQGVEKMEHSCCWWECEIISLPWEIVWQFHKELSVELPYDPGSAPGKRIESKI